MNAKQLFLVITLANVVGISALIFSRRVVTDESQEPQTEEISAQTELAEKPFEIPPRPTFATVEPVSQVQAEVTSLREMAFKVAEFTNQRLKDNPGALCLLGKLYLRSGDLEGAKKIWDRALELDDSYVETYLDLAQLEEKHGRLESSQAYYEKVLELAPRMLDAYDPLIEVLHRQAKFSEAAVRLTQQLSIDKDSTKVWCALGRTYQLMEDFEKAKQSFQKALAVDAHSHVAALGLMFSCRSLGETEAADRAAELVSQNEAVQFRGARDRKHIEPDREKMRALFEFTANTSAELLRQAGDTPAAVSQLEQTTQVLPESRQLRKQLIELYLMLGDVDKAIEKLRDCTVSSPQDAEAWLDFGIICLKARRFDASEEALRRVIELAPESDRGYALLAQTQMPAGRNQKAAVESARQAVKIAPSADNRYILATAFYNAGDIPSTKAELQRAISLAPDNAEYIDALRRIQ